MLLRFKARVNVPWGQYAKIIELKGSLNSFRSGFSNTRIFVLGSPKVVRNSSFSSLLFLIDSSTVRFVFSGSPTSALSELFVGGVHGTNVGIWELGR